MVGHKNVQLFFAINPVFIGGFLHVYVPMETGINILHNKYKIDNFTSTVSAIVANVPAVWYDRGRQLPAVCFI